MKKSIVNEFFRTAVSEADLDQGSVQGTSGASLLARLKVQERASDQGRRTQIVCTMGPACNSIATLERLSRAGMSVARLNFSHGTHAEHAATIRRIRSVARRTKRRVIIMQDLQGPKIRTGSLEQGWAVELKTGATFTITTSPVAGNALKVSTSYAGLPGSLQPGDRLLIDDGAIELMAYWIDGFDVHTRVVHGGLLKERKGINLPGVEVGLPILTEKDRADLAFGIEQGIDWLAASFVNRAADIVEVRRTLASLGPQAAALPVIAKIETQNGVANLQEILDVADGVMVARGDLGVELPPEFLPPIQKTIIREANARGKFVITATQMLQSMIEHPRPTRAEASDVANAVYDGTNAVMLSAETASGAYPVEAVKMMARLVDTAEATCADWGNPLPAAAPSTTHPSGLVNGRQKACARLSLSGAQPGKADDDRRVAAEVGCS